MSRGRGFGMSLFGPNAVRDMVAFAESFAARQAEAFAQVAAYTGTTYQCETDRELASWFKGFALRCKDARVPGGDGNAWNWREGQYRVTPRGAL